MNKDLIFGAVAGVLVLSGVGLAFTVTGSPGHQRALAFDERRLDDVEHIASAMIPRYFHSPLPRVLPSDIAKSDPETGKPYEYKRIDPGRYQLCVIFDSASPQHNDEDDIAGYRYRRWRNHHGGGRQCFTFAKNAQYPDEPQTKTPR